MRIIDKNTDFYDYWQTVYPDASITFDRTDSFLLTKEIMCWHLRAPRWRYPRFVDGHGLYEFVLLQICNSFWLFLVEITKVNEADLPTDYSVELIASWKNYNKKRRLIRLDIIDFSLSVDTVLYDRKHYGFYDKSRIKERANTLIQAVDSNDYAVETSIDKWIVHKGDGSEVEKHIPLLKACGIASCVDPLEVFLAFEEFFSLEKSSQERTASVGLTNEEKIGNHGFDMKTSFRGYVKQN